MIFPIFVCKSCGRYGGLGLSFSQSVAKAAQGHKVDKDTSRLPDCPDGHGPMYEIQPDDRLIVDIAYVQSVDSPDL